MFLGVCLTQPYLMYNYLKWIFLMNENHIKQELFVITYQIVINGVIHK